MDKNGQLKHLEMIQSVINRLAGNSFLIKGWTITIALAGFGLFANNNSPVFLISVTFGDIIFWILDAYYLRQERLFRALYEDMANIQSLKKRKGMKVLSMDTSKYYKRILGIPRAMFSFPTVLIYIAILAMAGFLYYGFN